MGTSRNHDDWVQVIDRLQLWFHFCHFSSMLFFNNNMNKEGEEVGLMGKKRRTRGKSPAFYNQGLLPHHMHTWVA